MGVRSRTKRRRAASAGGAVDLISGLCDDVLVHILELLPDARDAARTGALSRRWHGLWTRVGSLTFDSSSRSRWKFKRSSSGDKVFLDFVNDALAKRAKTTDAALDLDHLAISFAIMSPADDEATKPLVLRSTGAAQEWIRYAMENAVKSFDLKLQLNPIQNWYRDETDRCNIWQRHEQPVIDLIGLPSSAKLETMHWELKGVRLQLPATAVFTSLVDLSLESIQLVDGSDRLLARLLSSACCPSLQKLQLSNLVLSELDELLIEARALLELTMSSRPMLGPATLKLKTPSLRILVIEDNYLSTLAISAPRLEELTFWPHQPYHIDVDGDLPSVRSLKVELNSHSVGDEDDDINNSSFCLLRCCTSLTRLKVRLEVAMEQDWAADIISLRIPHLPHLISLTVHVDYLELHLFGVGLSGILKQCSYLKYLRVHCSIDTYGPDIDTLCDHLDHNESYQIYLANIQEVQLTGLAGTECESSFIQGVLAHATQLQKVALSLDPKFRLYNMMIDSSRFILCGNGTWVCHEPSLSYEWNSHPIHN